MSKCQIPTSLLPHITEILIKDEGLRESPYQDTRGYWTIGVGHFIGSDLRQLRLETNLCLQILEKDIAKHWHEACEIFGEEWLLNQQPGRQAAILSLVFNLGAAKLKTFTQTLPAIKAENWDRAAGLLRGTKWARDVDPKQRQNEGRDDRIAEMLRSGDFHAYYDLDKKMG